MRPRTSPRSSAEAEPSRTAIARRATLRVVSLASLACVFACGGPSEPRARPNVLLVVVDTLRADRLSCAGYGRGTTPHLDALAARGARFTHVSAPRAKTTPSMASLMTGLYPHDHGVRDLTRPLDGRPTTLAEVFAASGYSTAAIVGNYVLRRELAGLDRGFARWDERLPDVNGVPPDDVPQRRATSLTDGALELLTGAEPLAGPWFVWLHYMDPHGAYDAPAEHRVFTSAARDLVPDPARPAPRGRQPWIAEYNVLPEERFDGRIDANAVRDRYDAEVRYVDAELGRLFGALDAAGLTEDTWIVVTADHGESLGEHDYWFEHGRNAYEPSIRVPLIVVPPRNQSAGVVPGVRHGDVSLADLFPTLCEWAGVEATQRVTARGPRGISRADLLLGDSLAFETHRTGAELARDRGRLLALAHHPVFCEKVERADLAGAVQAKAVRLGDWKLLRRYARDGATLRPLGEELYDLAQDPAEERDLAAAPPPEAPLADLRAALLEFVAADAALADLGDVLQREREALERERPDVMQRLRALGY